MVTYSELFMFCDLVIGIISLVILITKKSNRHTLPKLSDYFVNYVRG